MSNDSENFRGARGIDINEPEEVRFWASALHCRENDIRMAVECCGSDIEVVREFIRGVHFARQDSRAHELAAAVISRVQSGRKAG